MLVGVKDKLLLLSLRCLLALIILSAHFAFTAFSYTFFTKNTKVYFDPFYFGIVSKAIANNRQEMKIQNLHGFVG